MLRRGRLLVGLHVSIACAAAYGGEEKSVVADGFEHGDEKRWGFFVPEESAVANTRWGIASNQGHTGTHAASLESIFPARMGIYPRGDAIPVHPGERYRLWAWVKADKNFKLQSKTPGVVLRATLFSAPGVDAPGGHWFVGIRGAVREKPETLAGAPVATEWTKIEGVIEIPADTSFMIFFVFVWKGSGRIFVDDVGVALVSADTPLTPVH